MAMLRAESLAAKPWERPTKEEDEAGAKASAEAARAATRAKTVFILTATIQLEENELVGIGIAGIIVRHSTLRTATYIENPF